MDVMPLCFLWPVLSTALFDVASEVHKRKTQDSNVYKRAKETLSSYLHKVVKDYFATHDLQWSLCSA